MPYPPPPNNNQPLERQSTPPPRKAVQELNSPSQKDGFYTELVSREDSAYQKFVPIKRGTPYSEIPGADERIIAQYAANPLFFLKQVRPGTTSSSDFGSTDLWVLWIWATQSLAEDSYNAAVTYDEENPSFPIFTREYEIKRKLWEANPTLPIDASPLTGLLSVAITAGGTGYTFASATIAGGGQAEAVILAGVIIDWVVTVEGSSVTGGAAMTITGDGTGATATARVQPTTALLVSQKKAEFTEDNPINHDYVRIVRTWMILPGAETIEGGYDSLTGSPNKTTKQKVVPGTAPTVLDSTRTFDGTAMYALQSSVEPVGDSGVSLAVLTTMWLPLPSLETIQRGYDQETGAATRVTRQKVLPATLVTTLGTSRSFNSITMYAQDSSVTPGDNTGTSLALLTTVWQQLPTTVLTVYDQDEETLTVVTTTYQVVAMPVSAPTPTLGIIVSFKKIDSQKAMKITRDFNAFLATTYSEQRFSADTFPALFDYTQYTWTDQCGAFSQIRASFSAKVKVRVDVTFDNAVQDIDGLTLIPRTLQLGRGVQISADVLVDAGMFTYVGTCTGTVTFDGSDPTYSDYLATIQNTMQLVAGESVLFKALIYKTSKVYEYML